MREIKITGYSCALLAAIASLGLYSYYVRELLAALTLFSVPFLFLALVGLAAFLVWCAGARVVIWAGPTTRNVLVYSRRLIEAYARP